MSDVTITSLEEMQALSRPIITLPGWAPDQEIRVRARRLSLTDMIEGGQVPNQLLGVAKKFITADKGNNPMADADPDTIQRFSELLTFVAKATLVEPTYDQIVEATGGLTDEQKQAIFIYATQGVRALEFFRNSTRLGQTIGVHGEGVRESAERLPSGAGNVREVRGR